MSGNTQEIGQERDLGEIERFRQREAAMLRALATIGESAGHLAHEIKNPITAVNVALRAVADQLGEDHQAVLGDLVLRMQRIEKALKRTLSFVRPIDVHESACDAQELFGAAVEELRPEIERAGAQVRVRVAPGGVRFRGDPALLKEVLTNLVANSIEAKPVGAHVDLEAARSSDGSVLLAVEDDGPGVPPALRDSLFQPFASTRSKSSGLGLTIARKLVEAHGGTLDLVRDRTAGARFEIRIPIQGKIP
jgi:signal transduction histidine kinase